MEPLVEITEQSGASANGSEIIKVDQANEQTLQMIESTYESTDSYNIIVRPWFPHDYAKKPNINMISQFALYKCMYEQCIFATNSEQHWKAHTDMHCQYIEYFKKKINEKMQIGLNRTLRERLIKFRECPYCDFQAKADTQFVNHMNEEHRKSIFQCGHCFYRSIEMDNMVLHNQEHHLNVTDPSLPGRNEILVCCEKREFDQHNEEVLGELSDQYVQKIKCGQGKNRI